MLAEVDGHPVAVRQGNILAVAFHPELTDDAGCTSGLWIGSRPHEGPPRRRARPDPRPLLDEGGEGRRVLDRRRPPRPSRSSRRSTRRCCAPAACRSCSSQPRARRRRSTSWRATSSSTGCRPPREWAVENADVRIAVMATLNTRELSQVDPKQAGARAEGAQADDGDVDAARGRGQLPLVAHAVPDARVRERGGHVAGRLRGLLLRGVPGDRRRPGDRVAAPVRAGAAGWPSGSRARRRSASRRAGTDITLGVAGRTWIPCVGEHNMPDGEFFTGPVEDSVNGEVASRSRPATAAARCRACACASRTARSWTPSAEQGEDFLHRDARHRRGRPPPRRARHRHELRHRHRHQGDPARREDRRHRAHGDRA